jgi:hypothetical protein
MARIKRKAQTVSNNVNEDTDDQASSYDIDATEPQPENLTEAVDVTGGYIMGKPMIAGTDEEDEEEEVPTVVNLSEYSDVEELPANVKKKVGKALEEPDELDSKSHDGEDFLGEYNYDPDEEPPEVI